MAASSPSRRSVAFAAVDRNHGESQPLLYRQDAELANNDDGFPVDWREGELALIPSLHSDCPVFSSIHSIRADIIEAIDDPYSIEQLKDPRMNVAVVRPLVDKLFKLQDVSIVYCLLVNRTQFLQEHTTAPHAQSVNITRALLCELVALRILRRTAEQNPGPQGLLLLANVLVFGFDPFQNAPQEVTQGNLEAVNLDIHHRRGYHRRLPALEIAIISESKTFLSSSACQKVVRAIYEGRVVYTPSTFIDILPDRYKQRPISLYDPTKAALLNQYRLIVPRIRNYMEIGQFIILLILYVLVMRQRDTGTFGITELIFIIYSLGFVLDQLAAILEHGWSVYTQNLWSFLDVMFAVIYIVYLFLRIQGVRSDDLNSSQQALDVLAIAAPVLVPRLAFNLMSENLLFVGLRAMMADFAILTALVAWCFGGFLLSMIWLGGGQHRPITIAKWMLWVWFGLDGTGIQRSVDLHVILGPMLMVAFAFLGNTLFLTILVSMLSNTFASIVKNASAEVQYRRAVLILEGVKSDAIFAYQPPFNILALCILLPLKFIVSPRWFHKINVAAVRTLNAPMLLVIGYVERRALWSGLLRKGYNSQARMYPRRSRFWHLFSRGFSAHGDIQAVFDTAPSQDVEHEESQDSHETDSNEALRAASTGDTESGKTERPTTLRSQSSAHGKSRSRSRRDSMAPFGDLRDQLRGMLNDVAVEEGDNTGQFGKNVVIESRFGKLEQSVERIENLLGKLCKNLGGDVNDGEGVVAGESPTIPPLEDDDRVLQEEAHR
ncbi:MAG: hypothetical protein M1818_001485 [Claussenomyces sp. TS43310]|nr:MAG: hypothetical protein M1818_001485 [Claussenomyces sp. TS43310]